MSLPIHRLVDRFDETISEVESLDVAERSELLHVEAHLVLMDGTELRVSEVWVSGELEKYSYYWLEADGETIMGWDNAPHHDELDSFPHHVHTEDGVRASGPKDGEKVLKDFRERFS